MVGVVLILLKGLNTTVGRTPYTWRGMMAGRVSQK